MIRISALMLSFGLLLFSSFIPSPTPTGETNIKWVTIEEAAKQSEKVKKKIFIDVYTDWCGWCKVMDQKTFSDPKVAAYINKHYYAVKFNAEGREPVILKGTTYKFVPQGSKGYHELAAALLNGQMSYPTTVYLDEEFNMLTPYPGYLDVNRFSAIISFFGGNHYKTVRWEEYEKNFKSLDNI